MKLQRRSRHARAQLSDKLLAYSAATAATLCGTSTASATAPGTPLDNSYPGFGGSLPSLSLSPGYSNENPSSPDFTVGGATFSLVGLKWTSTNHSSAPEYTYHYHHHTTGESIGGSHFNTTDLGFSTRSRSFIGSHRTWSTTYGGGKLGLKVANGSFPGWGATAYVHNTRSGSGSNAFSGNHSGSLGFTTIGGGTGYFTLHLDWNYTGPTEISITGGSFFSAIPEPSSVAYGLGLVALGYAGIREHRRRRAAKVPKSSV